MCNSVLAKNLSGDLLQLCQRLSLPRRLESLYCCAIREPGKGHDLHRAGIPTGLDGKLIEGLAAMAYLLRAYDGVGWNVGWDYAVIALTPVRQGGMAARPAQANPPSPPFEDSPILTAPR